MKTREIDRRNKKEDRQTYKGGVERWRRNEKDKEQGEKTKKREEK